MQQTTSTASEDVTLDTRWNEEIERVLPVIDAGMLLRRAVHERAKHGRQRVILVNTCIGQKKTLEIVAAVRQLTGEQISFLFRLCLCFSKVFN